MIPGEQTSPRTIELTRRLGRDLRQGTDTPESQDIRGFLSNRMMYAMLREACYLVESGIADIETVDRSFRNDIGYWATLAGPFRWMDLTGIPAYAAVMEGLLPEAVQYATKVPKMMRDMVASGAQGSATPRASTRTRRPARAGGKRRGWISPTRSANWPSKYD